jgi:pimeloyl-ACP methyl ester carboxylesterase
MICAALSFTASAGAAPRDARYTQPGRLVDAGGHRLNLYCSGSGSPAVVFDSGWEDWAPAWHIVQPAIARYTRTCTYDRAGSGFSDPGPLPRTSVRIADDLHNALHAAHIAGPYILVGHSFGSYNTRVFADRYMPEVAGLVLVDGENADVEPAKDRAADDKSLPPVVRELLQCRDALEAGKPLPKLPTVKGKPVMYCNQQFFRGLPERTWSAPLNASVLDVTRTKSALYTDFASEMAEMPWDEQYLIAHRRSFGSRPVRILTAQNHYYDTARTPPALHRKHLKDERQEALVQARWLSLSSDAKQIFAMKSGHYIELDQPDLVIAAIREELRLVRR